MGLLELLIVVVLLFWLFGYFGRGRFYGSRGGTVVGNGALASGSWVHTLLVIVVILIVLRLIGVHF